MDDKYSRTGNETILEHAQAKAGFNIDLLGVIWSRNSTLVQVWIALATALFFVWTQGEPQREWAVWAVLILRLGATLSMLSAGYYLLKVWTPLRSADPYETKDFVGFRAGRAAELEKFYGFQEQEKVPRELECDIRQMSLNNWAEVGDQLQIQNRDRLSWINGATWCLVAALGFLVSAAFIAQ
jgi:hypothetical protein